MNPLKLLVVANQKGGVGKTATLVHLAYYLSELGLRVVVIDLDTQGNASFSLDKVARSAGPASALFQPGFVCGQTFDGPGLILFRSDALLADIEKAELDEASAAFAKAVDAIKKTGADVCLVDTAPSLGNAMVAALMSASHVLSPIELEAYSIQGIEKMLTTIRGVRRVNKRLAFLGMLPSRVDNRNPRHAAHLTELTEAYESLVLPVTVPLRSSIADALALGVPVWRIKKTAARAAAREVRTMTNHVATMMECAQ